MRTTLVVVLWLAATAGVTFVANGAVELVDLQVFPGRSRIEVLSLPEPTEPPATTVPAVEPTEPPATTVPAVEPTEPLATTVPAVEPTEPPATTTAAPATTTAAPATTTAAPATTTAAPALLEIVVLTRSLPQARVGEVYSVDLVATGGSPPYQWSLVSGPLPSGLGLSAGGTLSGVPASTTDTTLVFQVADAAGQAANSPGLVMATAPDRFTVTARGGTVFIDVSGDSISLFLASPADGYSTVIVEPGGFRVEVQFVPLHGDSTSWVVCEVNDGVGCSTG